MRRSANILLALLALGWVLLFAFRAFHLPYYGFELELSGLVTDADPGSAVRPRDGVISVNGHSLMSAGSLQRVVDDLGRGAPLRLVLERGGKRLEVEQPALARPSLVLAVDLAAKLVALLFLAIGTLVVLRRRTGRGSSSSSSRSRSPSC